MVREVICFAVGAATGFGAAYVILKKKYDAIVKEEVDAAVEWAQSHGEKESQEEKENEMSHEDLVDKRNEIVSEKYEGGDAMDAERPYIIPEEDFVVDDEEYTKVSLDYYTDDEMLYEGEEPIINVEQVVGRDNINLLHGGPDDVIYVRNEKYGIDYEICKIAGRFTEYS